MFTYKETGTQPIVAHGNGMSKDLVKIFTEKLQIGGKRKHNKTKKKNTKTMVNKCMETFVDKKVKYWTEDYTKEIEKL